MPRSGCPTRCATGPGSRSTQDRVAARSLVVEIVQRPDLPYSTVLPRRRVVGRTPAWITGHRRCVRDHERLPHHRPLVMIRITSRRLTQQQ
ncbi:hypothetical protein [Saccharothrix sp. 6-C]|uniref:hypothetical protein n=1 Tax=Saccharothrix sp. 6-C TaxID=2781735 RepID=UPI001916E2A0|nr:hypothetical protein [Saccharothrix sp. 6-C]